MPPATLTDGLLSVTRPSGPSSLSLDCDRPAFFTFTLQNFLTQSECCLIRFQKSIARSKNSSLRPFKHNKDIACIAEYRK